MSKTVSIRRVLLRDLSILLVVMGLAIFGATFLGARAAVGSLAESLVGRTYDTVEARLREFFNAPARQLLVAQEQAVRIDLGAGADPEALDGASNHPFALLEPIVDVYPQISSAMLARADGREHMLFVERGAQRYRVTDPVAFPGEARWVEWQGGARSARNEAIDYDARRRPWHREALDGLRAAETFTDRVHWTEPYSFFTSGEPGVTASTAFRTPSGETLVLGVDLTLAQISDFTRGLRMGGSGIVMVLTADERVIGLPNLARFEDADTRMASYLEPVESLSLASVVPALRASRDDDGSVVRFRAPDGRMWWGMARPFPLAPDRSLIVVAAAPESDLLGGVVMLRTIIGMIVVVVLACGLARAAWVATRISRPIESLVDETVRISAGDLEPGPPVETDLDEVHRLAEAHEHMRRGIDAQMRLQRVERDLDIARDIQMGLLPKQPPDIAGFAIAGWSRPADQTGGDYFDWFTLPGGRTVVTLADATGHGIGPALLVAVCRAYVRATASLGAMRLAEAVAHINRMLAADTPDGRFITAVFGVIDPARCALALASAGHGPQLYLHAAGGEVEVWPADAPPLGVIEDLVIDEPREVAFAPGDTLLLTTDGFFEWRSAAGEQYGVARLVAFLKSNHGLDPDAFIQALHEDVLAFAGGTTQDDDLTAVVVKRTGT
jgi:serine phosphatase RsbU (regulator of sigma subunit)